MKRALLAMLPLLGACSSDVGDDLGVGGGFLAAPTRLAGVPSADGTRIFLSWADNSSGESGYRVDVSVRPIDTAADALSVRNLPADATSDTCPAGPGARLYFRVLAVTSDRQSKPSATILVETPDVPQPPTSLKAVPVSPVRIDLSWDDSWNETSYRLERSEDGGSAWSTAAVLPADTTRYADTPPGGEEELLYRLYAANPDGESAPSDIARATPLSAAFTVSVVASGDVGQYSCMAVDAAGAEHISFYDSANGDCLYATDAGGSFVTVLADWGRTWNVGRVGGGGTSIALDASGRAHIAASDLWYGDLRYITNASGTFSAATLDTSDCMLRAPKLKISPLDGSLQIVFGDEAGLKRAVSSPQGWTFESFTFGGAVDSASFAIDASGVPHVSYLRSGLVEGICVYELVYARKRGGAWLYDVVPTERQPQCFSIALDPSGAPRIAYASLTTYGMHLASLDGGSWTSEVIDQEEGRSFCGHNSISIDAAGRIHVAYEDIGASDLRYARKDPGKPWVRRVVDSDGQVGKHNSIAVDARGGVHISYYDQMNRRLKRASNAP